MPTTEPRNARSDTQPKLTGRGGPGRGQGKKTNAERGVESKTTAMIGLRVSESTKEWYDGLPDDTKKALRKEATAVIERACAEAHII